MTANTYTANVVTAFALANLVLLGLTLYVWGRIADAAGLTARAKWIGVLALQVSYANWKMPFYYSVLTDTFALALGALSLLFFLERRTVGLVAIAIASALVWPTLPYFCALLVAFPQPADEPAEILSFLELRSKDERVPGNRCAGQDVRLACIPVQQRHEAGVQRHEQARLLFRGQSLD